MKTRRYESRVAPARQSEAAAAIPAPKVSQVQVGERGDGQRLDNFLGRILSDVPRSHLFRVIRKGEVRVNDKGTRMAKAVCPVCGTNLNRILGKE